MFCLAQQMSGMLLTVHQTGSQLNDQPLGGQLQQHLSIHTICLAHSTQVQRKLTLDSVVLKVSSSDTCIKTVATADLIKFTEQQTRVTAARRLWTTAFTFPNQIVPMTLADRGYNTDDD